MTTGDMKSREAVKSYRIGELGKMLDMSPRTIRYYEEIGLLNTVKRMEGGRRIYTDNDLRRLRFIKKLKLLGLSLNDMAELERIYSIHRSNKKVLPRVVELLRHHDTEIDIRIRELAKLKSEMESYIARIEEKLQAS
ncbi:MAG: MerR family transcriptional regulator [Deltaproteobacteria bacterium]|nr:MerR family transcriptional regulator [Candidatus Anaeroferrophillus wilburensis]MBN2888832.1 MerR family transcriptional regulator [Deltaproteobacteria bacterium]